VAVFLLLAAGFGYLGTQGPGPSASNPQNALPAVRVRAIETYEVCDRVLGENPELTAEDRAKFGAEPDPATWKKLELHCPKRDGSWADVTMVQPPSWLAEQGARVGGTVDISVPECGIDGHAQVLSIGPCPPVKRGQGHVVTATFRHHAASTVHLRIEGSTEPIRCTGNHPFWSEDRRQFVRADALKIGEHLSSLHGPAALVSRTDQPNPKPVFNIQVQGTHVYLVGADGVLVHNGVVCPRNVDLLKLRPSPARDVADAAKLERMGPFDWNKYKPIIVKQNRYGVQTIQDGMTRVEAARRAGITQLPAFVFPKR
jgi:hypothetical protein